MCCLYSLAFPLTFLFQKFPFVWIGEETLETWYLKSCHMEGELDLKKKKKTNQDQWVEIRRKYSLSLLKEVG